MNVRPAGREACNCASPYNSILERLDAMEAEILAVQATANSAMGVANAQAGAAASSASAAAASATAAGNAAISAAADASDALTQATASAGSADDAADSAADALTALQTIENTIASVLASDIGGKVDKLTTAGFYLYMHNGSTQGEVQPVVAPTAATIPIRDSNGRMQAADPASGATDKTLVTANWVSQTGDSAPNNLAHRTSAETYTGDKTFINFITGLSQVITIDTSGGGVANKYQVIMKLPKNVGYGIRQHFLIATVTRQRDRAMDFLNIYINGNNALGIQMILRNNTENYTYILSQDSDYIYLTVPTDGTLHDSIQCIILAATQKYGSIPSQITVYEAYDAIPGTEVGRLTP